MWIERPPIKGETFKVVFAGFTGMGTIIGILLHYFNDKTVVDIGMQLLYLDKL